MANLNPSHPHMYDHFKFTLAIMDEYASKDIALVKAITENLYGCKISDRNLDKKYFATIITDYDKLLIKKNCYECEDIVTNPGSFILYYLALAIYHIPRWNANNDDKDIIEKLEKIKEWLFDNTDLLREATDKVINDAKQLFNNTIKYIKTL